MEGFQEYQLTYREVEIVQCDTDVFILRKYIRTPIFASYAVAFYREKQNTYKNFL